MSFLNIKDKSERDKTIKEYLALKKRLKQRNQSEHQDSQDYHYDLEQQYEPLVASHERMAQDITEHLVPIKDELHQLTSLARPTLTAVRAGDKRRMKSEPEHQPEKREALDKFGPLSQEFLSNYMDEEKRKRMIDTSFGIRYENDEWKIGNKRVLLNPDDSMFLDGESYEGTPGFWSLVTEKDPSNYTNEDLSRYKELLHEASVLHQDYDRYVQYPRANRSKKWTKILAPIWQEFRNEGIVPDEEDEEDGYETPPTGDEPEEIDPDETDENAMDETTESEVGHGLKMYFQKKGRCYALSKTTDGGIKFRPRPKLAGVRGDGLYLRHGSDIYHGEGLLLGKNSPFRNIPVLGWLL